MTHTADPAFGNELADRDPAKPVEDRGRRRRGLMLRLLALVLLAACTAPPPTGCALAPPCDHVGASTPPPQPDPLAACLDRARRVLAQGEPFAALEARLASGALECPLSAPSAFEAFEGPWVGRWGGFETRHLWCTVEPGVQRVVLEHAGIRQRGVNVAHAGRLCGIVLEPDGSERVHVGHWRKHRGHRVLEWQTESRRYLERVDARPGGSLYLIQELIGGELGNFAVYTRP